MGSAYSSLNNHEAAADAFKSSIIVYEKYGLKIYARNCAIRLTKSLEILNKQA